MRRNEIDLTRTARTMFFFIGSRQAARSVSDQASAVFQKRCPQATAADVKNLDARMNVRNTRRRWPDCREDHIAGDDQRSRRCLVNDTIEAANLNVGNSKPVGAYWGVM